jgi:diguanylate cyclase (GGDEF)-like protein/PAS domain S-box-containing protein
MRRALDSMSSAVTLIDVRHPGQPVIHVSPAFARLTGYQPAEVIGRSWKLSEGPETDPDTAARLHAAVDSGVEIRVRIRHHRRDGTAYWSETLLVPITATNGGVTHYMSVQKDVTEDVEAMLRAAHMAYHDPLTGLPNRTQLQEHLSLALARAQRKDSAFALIFFDLDDFKQINDRHGHEAGDRLLQDVAQRWQSIARDGDVLARYGGDEFVLLTTDVHRQLARDAAAATARRYVDSLARPFNGPGTSQAPGLPITIGVSAGIARYPDDATTPTALLLAADAAMYVSKRADDDQTCSTDAALAS